MFKKFVSSLIGILKDQSGKLEALAWVLGATVVTVLVVLVLMRIMPSTTENFFTAAVNWIRSSFGF